MKQKAEASILIMDKWDKRFVKVAKGISDWSKDPSTHVAAIAVRDRKIIATGYNGFPKGIADKASTLNDRASKLRLMVHAEKNMIYNAVEHGVSLKDSTVYIWGLPCCDECWKGLVQTGVTRVVMPSISDHGGKWEKGCEFGATYMKSVGINITEYKMFEFGFPPYEKED